MRMPFAIPKSKLKGLLNQKGFTLIELISVTLISSMLIIIAGVGLSVFFSKYQELNAYVELQKDAVEFLNYLKNGYAVGTGSHLQFNGVASAKALKITGRTGETGKGNGLKITPPSLEEYPNDFVHFFLRDGAIKADYMYNGVQVSSPKYVFPKRAEMDRVTIESFTVSDANANNALYEDKILEPVCIVTVELKAKVKITNNRYRHVRFQTSMAMKNMVRPLGAP